MAQVGGGCDKDAYTRGDKHKGGWLRASERAGIRGGPSYIDFCPRHHPRRSSATPCEPPYEAGAGGGSGGRLQVWGGRSERERWKDGREQAEWRWRVRDRRGRGGGETSGEKSLCARRTFDGRGPRGWHSVTFNPRPTSPPSPSSPFK